jgi:zinc/manganese transport system substrate-binding protein
MRLLSLVPIAALVCAQEAPLRVLTTTTDLADIVRAVGGDRVQVSSLCKGPEDPHFLEARPSFLRLASRADMVVVAGMDYEAGYLPLLLRDCGNADVRPGGRGHVDASARVRKLQVPAGGAPSRAHGDVHAYGNPHYLLDPANAVIVAEEVARALGGLRPADAKAFGARAEAFRGSVEELLFGPSDDSGSRAGGLLERFRPYKGAPVVSYHDDMPYLAARFGLEVVGTIEPKPGVPPTARHVDELKKLAKARGVKAVLHTSFQPKAPVEALCAGTGAKAVLIAHQPRATDDAPDILAMYRRNAEAILRALQGDGP